MSVIGYARVSTRQQAQGQSLEQQQARLISAGATEIYTDQQSRSRDDRKGLNQVLDLIQANAVDEVIFTRLDRITDSPTVLEKAITICLESGVRVRSLDDAIDFSTVGGRLHARILCNLARSEVERLSERITHGWRHTKAMQKPINPPFGYRRAGNRPGLNQDTYRTGDRTIATVAREVFECFFETRTVRALLRELSRRYPGTGKQKLDFPRSVTGMMNWLQSEFHRGHTPYLKDGQIRGTAKPEARIVHHNTHPDERLISDEEWQQVLDLLQQSRDGRGWGSSAPKHALTGLVYCGECNGRCYRVGRGYQRQDESRIAYRYGCRKYPLGQCTNRQSMKEPIIEAALIDALCTRAIAIADLAQQPDQTIDSPELQALRSELQFYQSAPGNRAETIIAELQQQIEAIKQQQSVVSSQQLANRELLLSTFSDSLYWQTLQPEEKRDLYRALCDRIVIRDGAVESVLLKV